MAEILALISSTALAEEVKLVNKFCKKACSIMVDLPSEIALPASVVRPSSADWPTSVHRPSCRSRAGSTPKADKRIYPVEGQ